MSEDVRGVVQGVLLAVAALLPIVNPLGTAPLFLSLTQDLTHAERAVLPMVSPSSLLVPVTVTFSPKVTVKISTWPAR